MTPETTLIVELLKAAHTGRPASSLSINELNWQQLVKSIIFHGVTPFALQAIEQFQLSTVPAESVIELRERRSIMIRRGMVALSELARLQRLFEESGIEFAVYKGPVLANRYYGDALGREFDDLDFLIRIEQLNNVRSLLASAGYECAPRWLTTLNESFLRSDYFTRLLGSEQTFFLNNGLSAVDIHWQLLPEHMLPKTANQVLSRLEQVPFQGRTIPTLSTADLIVTLSCNAGMDGWARLIWIHDLMTIVKGASPDEMKLAIENAEELRCSAVVFAGLQLVHRLYGIDSTPVPASLAARVEALVDASLRFIDRARLPAKRECIWYCLQWHESSYRWKYLSGELFTPGVHDWEQLRLPESLSPLYIGLKPYLLMRNWLKQRISEL